MPIPQLKSEAVDAIGVAGQKMSLLTYTGAGTGVYGLVTSTQFATVVGVLMAVAGFVMNWWFKRQAAARHERESQDRMLMRRAEHEARMRAYERGELPETAPAPLLEELEDLGGEG